MVDTKQLDKEVLMDYMERFKKEKSIVEISFKLKTNSFVKTTREFKKLNEEDDKNEIFNMKKIHLKHR